MSRWLLAIRWKLVVFLVPMVFLSQELRGAGLYSVSGNILTLPYNQGYTSGCDKIVKGIKVEVWEVCSLPKRLSLRSIYHIE